MGVHGGSGKKPRGWRFGGLISIRKSAGGCRIRLGNMASRFRPTGAIIFGYRSLMALGGRFRSAVGLEQLLDDNSSIIRRICSALSFDMWGLYSATSGTDNNLRRRRLYV